MIDYEQLIIDAKKELDLKKSQYPFAVPLIRLLDTIISKVEAITKMEGPQGERGEVGPQGEQGLPGLPGPAGKDGTPGKDGKDGRDGKDGKPGQRGERGQKGDNGKDGHDGKDGKDGKNGSPDTPEQVQAKLEKVGIDARYVKNIPTVVRELPNFSFIGRPSGHSLVIDGAGQDIRRLIIAGDISVTRVGDGVARISATVPSIPAQVLDIAFVIDGAGAAISTGLKGYLEIPFACTINQVTLLADRSGSIVVDIFKCTYSQFDASSTHPVSGDKITASAPPTISSTTKSQDATLTGWTTSLSAGDILAFNVNSATTVQRVTLSLKVTKTT